FLTACVSQNGSGGAGAGTTGTGAGTTGSGGTDGGTTGSGFAPWSKVFPYLLGVAPTAKGSTLLLSNGTQIMDWGLGEVDPKGQTAWQHSESECYLAGCQMSGASDGSMIVVGTSMSPFLGTPFTCAASNGLCTAVAKVSNGGATAWVKGYVDA